MIHADRLQRRLYVDGGWSCWFIENQAKLIPAGTYAVVLTESARAKSGGLWTPWPDNQLPLLVDVPGRTGIRIHAANRPDQLEGCIAVGLEDLGNGTVGSSRAALTKLRTILTFPTKLEIK